MEQQEAFRKLREAQAKGGLIGTIHNSEVYELLKQSAENDHKPATAYIADPLGVMKEHIDSRADRLDAALRS